jgi:hypothetical protein
LLSAITEFPLSGAVVPVDLKVGPDGNLWFTEELPLSHPPPPNFPPPSGTIGRITPAGDLTEFPIPEETGFLTVGPDRNLWFTQSNAIGRITPSGAVTDFPLPAPSDVSGGLTVGPDGNLWFTDVSTLPGAIGRVDLMLPHVTGTVAVTPPAGSNPVGQAVTITATVLDQAGLPLAGVPVTFSIIAGPNAGATGINDPADGRSGPDGRVQFTYVGAGGPGTDTIAATALLPTGVRISAPQVMTQWVEPPTVANLQSFGVHLQPTTLVVTFSQPMDAARAESLAEYRLIGPGPDHKFGTKDDHRIRIRSARYNPATNSVVLRPVRRLPLHDTFQLTVKGTAPDGLTSTLGILLDGAKTGQPGSNYVARITGKLLVPPIRHRGGKQAAAAHGHSHR